MLTQIIEALEIGLKYGPKVIAYYRDWETKNELRRWNEMLRIQDELIHLSKYMYLKGFVTRDLYEEELQKKKIFSAILFSYYLNYPDTPLV